MHVAEADDGPPLVLHHSWPWWASVIACLLTGAVIGTGIGLLVARLGIPSFVVTLAAFLGLQGVLLRLINEGGTISVRDKVLLAINNDNLPVWLGWLMYVVIVGLFALLALRRYASRRAGGLQTQGLPVILIKVGVLALLLVLLVGLTFLLSRTAFGRHVYAVGGNTEAARRAGILIASRDNSVSPSTGGADTLLYSVGAAVIGGTSLFGGKGRVLDAISRRRAASTGRV